MNSIAEITDAFIEEVINRQPDRLILSGDLTFNGEEKSHEELAMKFLKSREERDSSNGDTWKLCYK